MKKKLIAIIVMLLLVGMSIISSASNLVERSIVKPLYTPHDPIYIIGNDDFTSENGVTGGSGTSSNPYIIEGWEIDASSQDGITIRNVSVCFTISNCYIYDGGINNDGIVFINVTNGKIQGTIITENRNGIMFRTQYPGKENSENNSINNNIITNNQMDGILFEHTGWGHHSNNLIYHNNITGNTQGIYMIMSAYNYIFFNNIISNSEWGINLSMCIGGGTNNKVYHNNFMNNGNEDGQACVVGGTLDNDWDDGYPSGGNFWSDYEGVDNFSGPNQNIPGSDGIGDTPYNITSVYYWEDDYDYYPLMEPWNLTNNPPDAPVIDGPVNGRIWIWYNYNFSLSDPDNDSISLRVDWGIGGPGKLHGPFSSGSIVTLNYSWRKKDSYTIRAQAIDTYGAESDWGTLEVTMPKTKPSIFNFPILNQIFERFPNIFPILRYLLAVV